MEIDYVNTRNIYNSSEYSLFKFLPYNRKIEETHVRRLTNVIKIEGWNSDKYITVSKDFEIIDGQHRFLACRNLNLPIFYQFSLNPNTRQAVLHANTLQSNWKLKNYLVFFKDDPSILLLYELADKHHIDVQILASLFLEGGKSKMTLNLAFSKTLKFTESYADIDYLLSFLGRITKFLNESDKKRFHTGKFIRILGKILRRTDVKEKQLEDKLTLFASTLYIGSSYEMLERQIIEIYNYNAKKNRIPLKISKGDMKKWD